MAQDVSSTADYKCPKCGAALFYKAKLKKWKCDYCRAEFVLEDLLQYKSKQKLEDNIEKEVVNENEETEEVNVDYITYVCKDCGAEIIADAQTTATFCIYCRNTAILKNKLVGKFAPDYIIPFKKDKDVAIQAFKNISKGRPLTPKDFNNEENIEKIRGVYVPFWLFDINVDGEVIISAKNISSWRSGDYLYTKTDSYTLIRDTSIKFYKIPADGSSRFDDDVMNTLEPFDFNELEEFNHGYLSGFYAEKYDQEADFLYSNAANRAVTSSKNLIMKTAANYSTKVITKDGLKAIPLDKKYVLLPVWMVNVKYKDKLYLFAMNGQTGEFIGDIPIDKKKATIIAICLFVAVFILVIVISYISYKTGGLS